MTLYPHMYQNVHSNLLQKNFSIQEWPLYKGLLLEKYSVCIFIFRVILKETDNSFQKGIAFCRSIYVKKVMKLLAFIFEQSSYCFQGHFFFGGGWCVCYLLWNFLFGLGAAVCCCVCTCNVSLLWNGDASGFISMGCVSLKSVKCPARNNRVTFNVLF